MGGRGTSEGWGESGGGGTARGTYCSLKTCKPQTGYEPPHEYQATCDLIIRLRAS